MTNLVKIPQMFSIDCKECDCLVPEPVRKTKKHFWISIERNKLMDELISRAILYADTNGWNQGYLGLNLSARATLKALYKASVLNDNEQALCRRYFVLEH